MVKFYHIIAFDSPPSTENGTHSGYYMGKTSDLVFKEEPDKTIDLDDGTTEVGSQKLTVSFSILEKLNNLPLLKEIWLLPVLDDYYQKNPDIIKIDLGGCEYHLEAKSGEIEKILFSALIRYAVETPAWDAIQDYFGAQSIIIGRMESGVVDDAYVYHGEDEIATAEYSNLVVSGCFAFVGVNFDEPSAVCKCGDKEIALYGGDGVQFWHVRA